MQQTLICKCGEHSRAYDNQKTCNVGEICKTTGFESLMTHTCEIIYLRQRCMKNARYLAKQLMYIVKDGDIYFRGLIIER